MNLQPYEVQYTTNARRQLSKLDHPQAQRIIKKIFEYTSNPDPLANAKLLQGDRAGAYRYRIGSYRAIFIVDDAGLITLLTILDIKHRKDIYK